MTDRRVVITGLGVITALGQDLDTYWQALLAGRSGVKVIERLDTSRFTSKIAGEIVDFDPGDYLDRREARRLDRFAQFAMAAAKNAITQAGLQFETEDRNRAGVIVGSGIGGLQELETQHEKLLEKGPERISPFTVPKLMVNAASGNISIAYGLCGPNTAVATACASGTHAMGDAFRCIRRGDADVMITGGSEAALTKIGMASFCALKALSCRNDEPTRASRPFDRDRAGFVLSEGAGIVVMEDYEHARKRNADILAEVAGYGMSGDGSHITAPDPSGRGAILAMKRAIKDAAKNPEQVDYINAHGTGTQLGDIMETVAVKNVFGPHANKVLITSTKSNLGHLLGASGGVELIATILAMKHGVIPPTINLENPDPQCDLDYVPLEPREIPIQAALSNSFGFGGHNACLLIQKI